MIRNLASTMTGYVLWTVIYLGGQGAVRNGFPDLHDEAGGTTAVPVLLLYLAISFAASLVAGFLTAKMALPPRWRPVWILAGLLLATGIPVQLGYWDQLPIWYHLVFLAALVPLTLLGGRWAGAGKGSE